MNYQARPEKFGFRLVGSCHTPRRLVEYWPAFVAYCDCDDRAEIEMGGFLSPYQYDSAIRSRVVEANSLSLDVRDFDDVTWSRYLWFDIDDADLENGLGRCKRLVSLLLERYDLDGCDLLTFFSGSKGFHIGLPTSLWEPAATRKFAFVCRSMAVRLAEAAGVEIDPSIYQAVQPFRAPNSRHEKTGLYKRLVSFRELERSNAATIRERALEPLPFEPPDPSKICERAFEDWKLAEDTLSRQTEELRKVALNSTHLNLGTLEFIRDGAEKGERNRRLFSATANLIEFGCPMPLATALLTESALDSGLPPGEVKRVIENAFLRKRLTSDQ